MTGFLREGGDTEGRRNRKDHVEMEVDIEAMSLSSKKHYQLAGEWYRLVLPQNLRKQPTLSTHHLHTAGF
jgi:hypothetical protein